MTVPISVAACPLCGGAFTVEFKGAVARGGDSATTYEIDCPQGCIDKAAENLSLETRDKYLAAVTWIVAWLTGQSEVM